MSEQIKQMFNNISPDYDKLNHLLSFNIDKKWRELSVSTIKYSRFKEIRALDLCAGTLDLTLAFLKRFPHSYIKAVDFSKSMLDMGAQKIPDEYQNQIELICADALNLPFRDNSFDVVFCGYGFRNLSDPKASLSEISRVLKSDGQLLILDFFKPQNIFTKTFHKTYGQYLLPTVGGLISKNKKAYTYLYESILNFYSLNECCTFMKKAGFTDIESHNFFMGVSSVITSFNKRKLS